MQKKTREDPGGGPLSAALVQERSMTGKVLLFGRLKDAFGADAIALPLGADTAATLRAKLAEANPDLADMLRSKSIRIAVNQTLVSDEGAARISPSDEIALLPPLSGG